MYKMLFAKKSTGVLPTYVMGTASVNGGIVSLLEDAFNYANHTMMSKETAKKQDVRKMTVDYFHEKFNIRYNELSMLKKTGASFSMKKEAITDLVNMSDIMMKEFHPENIQSLREKISEAYLTAADMELKINSFLPSKKISAAENKIKILEIKKILEKSLEVQPENEQAKFALIELKHSFHCLLDEKELSIEFNPMRKY